MMVETHNSGNLDVGAEIRRQRRILGHEGYGVTEFRTLGLLAPMVAYTDNDDDAVRLCLEKDGKTNIYIGAQPRPAHEFDLAPNRWVPARGGSSGNCARDDDIEYVTTLAWDLDVGSRQRQMGHPASDEELERTLFAARLLSQHEGLTLCSAIVCTGNGHQLWAPVIPISVDGPQVALQFKRLCEQIAAEVAGKVDGVRIDPIYNLSRVARVAGTWNLKGQPLPDRPHRRACFVMEPPLGRSLALHYMLRNIEVNQVEENHRGLPTGLKCDLARIEECEFIQWCRRHANEVSEPAWFALISNLAPLDAGFELIHAISALDGGRYDYADTQRLVERVLREGYKPASCKTIMSPGMVRLGREVFRCSRIGNCPARAPMYMAVHHIT